jgi:hypothetical protein
MARFAAVRSRDEVKQANYLRLISECQEKTWKISTHAGNNGVLRNNLRGDQLESVFVMKAAENWCGCDAMSARKLVADRGTASAVASGVPGPRLAWGRP